MFLLYKDFAEAKAAADQIIMMGDLNVSSLAERISTVGRHLSVEVGRQPSESSQEARQEAPIGACPARRWGEHLQPAEDFTYFMSSHNL